MSISIKALTNIFLMLLLSMTLAACSTDRDRADGSGTEHGQDSAEQVELTISAAASLTDAMKEIQTIYEINNPSVKLNFNFGASGALQQQIEQGAPVDLFISAAAKNMKALVDKQFVESDKQQTLLTNELVVIVPEDGKPAVTNTADLTKETVTHIAVGIPESVPAGSYTKEALTKGDLWDQLLHKMVQAKDVRQVLQYVETGNADAGFVYKTDALSSQKVKIAFTVEPFTYSAIQYPVGIVKATKHSRETEHFYNFLQTDEALSIFVKYGFSTTK